MGCIVAQFNFSHYQIWRLLAIPTYIYIIFNSLSTNFIFYLQRVTYSLTTNYVLIVDVELQFTHNLK